MTTLFAEPSPPNSFFSPYVVSFVLHGAALSLVGAHFIESHRVIERFPSMDRFEVRIVNLHSPQPIPARTPGSRTYSTPLPATSGASASEGKASAGKGSEIAAALQVPVPHLMPVPRLLIQPEAPKNVVLPEKTPIPLLVLWGPEKVVVKRPMPQLPQTASIAEVHPTLETPIKEENLSEFKLAASPISTSSLTTAGTTSPIVVHGPEPAKKLPQTTSVAPQPTPPTPAKILSLSDVRVREGDVAVPLANQGSSKSNPGMTIPGVLHDPSAAIADSTADHANANGAGKSAGQGASTDPNAQASSNKGGMGNTGKGAGAAATANTGTGGAAAKSGANGSGTLSDKTTAQGTSGNGPPDAARIFPSQASGSGNSTGSPGGSVHLSLPHDGQFGVVVIGSSVSDQYPETASMWSGRMASTVYLRVGQAKSWIMQYALPNLIEAANPGGGRLEAPWPFEIVRPNIDPDDDDSDAVILHGFVNQVGRFEKLQVVFPPQMTQAGRLVNMMNEWQFRPARLNGAATAVEVLIVIPDQSH